MARTADWPSRARHWATWSSRRAFPTSITLQAWVTFDAGEANRASNRRRSFSLRPWRPNRPVIWLVILLKNAVKLSDRMAVSADLFTAHHTTCGLIIPLCAEDVAL
jgi:hypothetical protein